MTKNSLNPSVPNAAFLYHQKSSKNCTGEEKGYIGNKWVNKSYGYYLFYLSPKMAARRLCKEQPRYYLSNQKC